MYNYVRRLSVKQDLRTAFACCNVWLQCVKDERLTVTHLEHYLSPTEAVIVVFGASRDTY